MISCRRVRPKSDSASVILRRFVTKPGLCLAFTGFLIGCACPRPPRNAYRSVVTQPVKVPGWSCEFFCDLAFHEASSRVSCSFLNEPKTAVACEFTDNTQEPAVHETRTIDNVWDIRIDRSRALSWAVDGEPCFGRPDGCEVCANTPAMMRWFKAGFSDSQVRISCSSPELQGDTLGTLVRVISCLYSSNCRS